MTPSHPLPPEDPSSIRLVIRHVSWAWWRIHGAARSPIYFGKIARNRFDAPAGEFGVLYVSKDPQGAFIETFGHNTGRAPFVTMSELRARELSKLRTTRALRLVDLRGAGLARMGADAELTSGSDYSLSNQWALALNRHPRAPDGLLYRSRHDPERTCAAIFDRAQRVIRAQRVGRLSDRKHSKMLASILDVYGYGLVS